MSNETTVERPVDVTNVTGQAEQERTVEPQAADGDNGTITLFRHPTNKMLGGVCSGLADYLNWDPITGAHPVGGGNGDHGRRRLSRLSRALVVVAGWHQGGRPNQFSRD